MSQFNEGFHTSGYLHTSPHRNLVELKIDVTLAPVERDRLLHSIDDRQFLALSHLLNEEIEDISQQFTNPENAKELGTLAYYSGAMAEVRCILDRLRVSRKTGGNTTEES